MDTKTNIYYKLCDIDGETKNGFKYQKGIVELGEKLNEANNCKPPGLFFTDYENFTYWYSVKKYSYYFEVETIPGEPIINCNKKYKTTKLNVVSDIKHLSEFEGFSDLEYCIKTLNLGIDISCELFQFMKHKEILSSLALYTSGGFNINFLPHTETNIKLAIKVDSKNLLYVKPSDKLLKEILKRDYKAIKHVKKLTLDIFKYVLSINPDAINYMSMDYLPQLFEEDMILYFKAVESIKGEISKELETNLIKTGHYSRKIKYSENLELALEYIKRLTPDNICNTFAETLPKNLCFKIVKKNPDLYEKLLDWQKTKEITYYYIEKTHSLENVPGRYLSHDICEKVFEKNKYNFPYIPEDFITEEHLKGLFKIDLDYFYTNLDYIPDRLKNRDYYKLKFLLEGEIPEEAITEDLLIYIYSDSNPYENFPDKYYTQKVIDYLMENNKFHCIPKNLITEDMVIKYIEITGNADHYLIPKKFHTEEIRDKVYDKIKDITRCVYIYQTQELADKEFKDEISNIEYIREDLITEDIVKKLIKDLDFFPRYTKYIPKKYIEKYYKDIIEADIESVCYIPIELLQKEDILKYLNKNKFIFNFNFFGNDPEIQMICIDKGLGKEYIDFSNYEVCKHAVEKDNTNILNPKIPKEFLTEELYKIALNGNACNLKNLYIPEDILLKIAKRKYVPTCIGKNSNLTEELYQKLIKCNIRYLCYKSYLVNKSKD